MMNTIALLAGLYRRRTRGEGCMLSTSQFGTSVFTGASRLAIHWSDPLAPARRGHDFGSDMLDRAFAAADGYLAICAPTEAVWRRLMGAVGLPIDTPVDPTGAELEAIMKSDSIEEWSVRLREARVPTGQVASLHRSWRRYAPSPKSSRSALSACTTRSRWGALLRSPLGGRRCRRS